MFKFKKGDVIFFDNNDFINYIIRWGSKGESGHTGLMIDEYNMAEFIKTGFRVVPISDILKDKKNRIIVGRLSKENREKLKINEKLFDNFILKMIGKKYDYAQLFKIVLAQFFKNIKLKYNNKSYFCSEFVTEAFIIVNILKDIIPSNITPKYLFDLFKDKEFGTLYII
jgi:uncharacterized protein YycO